MTHPDAIVRYAIHLRLSPRKTLNAEEFSFAAAEAKARGFNAQSHFGRRSCVYGFTQNGERIFVPYRE